MKSIISILEYNIYIVKLLLYHNNYNNDDNHQGISQTNSNLQKEQKLLHKNWKNL